MDDESGPSERLQQILKMRWQELVGGLVEEFENLHREIAALKREVAALSDYQASRWLVLDAAEQSSARLPGTVVIEPDQLLRQEDGFYPAEYTDAGVPFRWTGPSSRFSFDIYVDRSNGVDLRLQALTCVDYGRQARLLLWADGEAVPVTLVPDGDGFVISALLPRRLGARATNLVFVVPVTLVPPGSSESRTLGIAFGRLSVTARPSDAAAGRIRKSGKHGKAGPAGGSRESERPSGGTDISDEADIRKETSIP